MKTPVLALALLTAGVLPAHAQSSYRSVDWQPWFGCWQANGAPSEELLCIVADGSAVRMVTLVDGAVRADTRIVADGQSRRTNQDGCVNEESARWSQDHRRVFLASEVTCPNGITRNVRGMLAFVGPDEWMSVQTVTGNDGTATRAVRFTPVTGLRIPGTIAGALRNSAMMRVANIELVDEADVIEAANYIDAGAIDEWMRIADAPYRLADGGSGVSALDQVGRMSHDVQYVERSVVRIVERPVYVVRSYGWRTYGSCWTPWGYDHFGWRSVGPYIRVRTPIVIHIGSRDRRYDYDDRYRSSRNDYGRYNRGSYDRSRDAGRSRENDRARDADRSRDFDRSRDGRVTREGYTRSGETRQQPARQPSQPARSSVSRGSTTRSSQPQRAPVVAPASTSRTARPRN